MRCANTECSRKRNDSLLGRLVGGREGVVRDGRWYCGDACFRRSLLREFYQRKLRGGEQRSSTGQVTARSLGAALLRMGKITWLQLEEALEAKSRNGGMPLAHYLLQKELIDRRDILEALGRHHRVPVATVGQKQPDQRVLAMLPAGLTRLSGVIPLAFDRAAGRLSLIMKDPSDLTTLLTIRQLLGCDVKVFQGDPGEIASLLDRHYPEERRAGAKAGPEIVATRQHGRHLAMAH